ncbi:hypothetical protein OESDEN_18538 [Oesophagostomum dentatum]|uniref:Cytochrome P450 n=1 Tax=Oesophagostomum dentatum TaxID=61180 RepID=A0A0B1SA15_OESDE|nr:hypothetical protein OESDEN_18538 [Oesophagostomum dentatum]
MRSIKNKEAVDLQHPIQVFIANIINKTLFGFSYEYDKSERLMTTVFKLTKLFDDIQGYKLVFLAQMFPFLQHFPVIGYYARGQFEKVLDELKENIRDDVKRSLESYTVDQEPECFVQAYYQRMQTNPNLE